MEHKFNELAKLVEQCKKNRENVPEELLLTRYRKPFLKLKQKIRECGEAVFPYLMLSELHLMPGDKYETYLKEIQEVAATAKKADYPKKLGEALCKYCDIELFWCYAMVMQYKLEQSFYCDYWISHTKKLGGKYYNEIIDMWYDSESKVWLRDNAFGIFYPPTKEAYMADLERRRDEIFQLIVEKTSGGVVCQCA